MSNKKGKVPASLKNELDSSDFTHDDLDFNILKLDPELRAVFEEKGYVARWINAKSYTSGGNFHKSGWRAYRHQASADRGSQDFNFGVSPEGYIIRNDLILAYKTKESAEKWANRLARRTQIQSGAATNRGAELREMAASKGVKAKILEGYDENNTDE